MSNEQVICKTFSNTYGNQDCIEVVKAEQPQNGKRYYFTRNGRVQNSNECWLDDATAREWYDGAAYKYGDRP
jgi:hypothetical protein